MMEAETPPVMIKVGHFTITEKEKSEFDNITGDAIAQCNDCDKLRRLEAYMKEEGLGPTAEAARFRLQALGSMDPTTNPVTAHEAQAALKASRADLKTWTASMATRGAAPPSGARAAATDPSLPPVRAAGTLHVQPGAPQLPPAASKAAPKEAVTEASSKKAQKPDSNFGGQVRSGKDYYQAWDKFAENEAGDSDDDEPHQKPAAAAAVPKPHAAEAAGAPSSAPARGPALTERLIAANQGLSRQEKEFNANSEKIKGNEFFRSKEYAQAVEHYTISLGFQPSNPSVRANRAAAYIKLRLWDAAVADCDEALAADAGNLKARVRRAAAKLELGKAAEAMEDIESALALDPANPELQSMREKADKALSRSTMRRIAIEEDDEDDQTDPGPAAAQEPQRQRTKIAVVEESDDDSGEEDAAQRPDQRQVSPTSPLPPNVEAAPGMVPVPGGGVVPAAAAAEKKVRIAVVEDDDSSDGDGVAAPSAPAAAKPAASPIPQAAVASSLPSVDVSSPTPTPAPAPAPTPAAAAASVPYQPTLSPDQQAQQLKEEGNRLFSQGNFSAATASYKQALQLDPSSSLLHANMAISKLQGGDARGSLSEASVAVALDPSYHKAMHRRAMAKRSLGLLQAARDDLKVAHDMLDPGHKDRAALAEEMRAVISEMVEAEKRKKREAAEQAAAARKKFHYKGGVTIEEEVDDGAASSAAAGGALMPAQVKKVEDDAAALALQLRKQASKARQEWELGEQRRRRAWEQEQAAAAALRPPPVQQPLQQAPEASSAAAAAAELDELRKRGNELFRGGDSLGALVLYEQCLQRDPGSIAVHANLALAKLSVGDPAGALHHCDAVLAADDVEQGTRVKALHRKAQALKALGRLEEALEAYKPVKLVLAAHSQVDSEMAEIARLIAKSCSAKHAAEEQARKADIAAEVARKGAAKAASHTAKAEEASVQADHLARELAAVKAEMLQAEAEAAASRALAEAASRSVTAAKEEARKDEEKMAACQAAADGAIAKMAAEAGGDASASLQQAAERERILGNSLYPQGRLEDAAAAYSRSIAAQPSTASYSNRALVMLKMKKAAAAESDCRAALALDPLFIKARHRLALALRDLGRLADALKEYDALLQASSTPKETAAVLLKERKELELLVLLQQQQPQQPRRTTIPIEESNSSDDEEPTLPVPTSSLLAAAPAAAVSGSPAASPAAAAAGKGPPSPSGAVVAPKAAASKVQQAAATLAAEAIDKMASKRPAAPRSALEFERSCKLVAGHSEVLLDFVKSVPPESYQAIFKDALNGAIVSIIARALRPDVASDPGFAERALRQLTGVSRFSMVASMMGKADKALVGDLIACLGDKGVDVSDLKAKYRIG